MVDLLLLAEAAHDAAGHHAEATAFGLAPPWWVALSMVALIGVMIYLKVPSIVAGMLDKKIDGIRQMLDEATTLRAEAEALRKEYVDKVANVEKDAAAMLEHAKVEARAIVAKAQTDSANVIARREKIAEDKIAAAERAAVEQLRVRAADAAAAAARQLIGANHSAQADKALVDKAIGEL
jgi:F-type H+-transporting ATPase subunit b